MLNLKKKLDNSFGLRGFSLIELLVVISIIGALAALSLVSYGGAQKQSRDTTRKSDLAQYRNALEAYAGSNKGMYPGVTASPTIIGTGNLCSTSVLYPYLSSTCLQDPKKTGSCATGASNFQYCYANNGSDTAPATQYVLFVHLESGEYWVVCSNGKVFKDTSAPTDSNCVAGSSPV